MAAEWACLPSLRGSAKGDCSLNPRAGSQGGWALRGPGPRQGAGGAAFWVSSFLCGSWLSASVPAAVEWGGMVPAPPAPRAVEKIEGNIGTIYVQKHGKNKEEVSETALSASGTPGAVSDAPSAFTTHTGAANVPWCAEGDRGSGSYVVAEPGCESPSWAFVFVG